MLITLSDGLILSGHLPLLEFRATSSPYMCFSNDQPTKEEREEKLERNVQATRESDRSSTTLSDKEASDQGDD